MAATILEVLARFEVDGPIGCTLPAVVTEGVVRTATNIDDAWIGTDAQTLLSHVTGRHCTVLNDADAAGIAEVRFGSARDEPGVVVMVTLGTGVGTALFTHGELVPNTELGHLEVDGEIGDRWASVATKDAEELGWKEWARRVDLYLTRLHALLWPDLIVLGGGVVKNAEKFVDRLDPGCELRIAQLRNNAGIVGAALAASGTHLAPA